MKLSNSWFDPTFVKELIAAKIFQNYLPTEEVNLIKVSVQGKYLGLYVNTETISKQFLNKHFGESQGALLKCEPGNRFSPLATSPNLSWKGSDSSHYVNTYELKSKLGWSSFIEFIDILNNKPHELPNVLNIDRVLWYLAANEAVLNIDSYNLNSGKNYYFYQTKDGLFQIIPWDLSESFINSFWERRGGNEICRKDPLMNNQLPLAKNLLNDSLYRKIYIAHLKTITQESLDTARISSDIDKFQLLAAAAVKVDKEKPYSNSQFFKNKYFLQQTKQGMKVNGVFQPIESAPFIPVVHQRRKYLLNYPEIKKAAPLIKNVSVAKGFMAVEVENGSKVELMATISKYNSKFQSFEMIDNGEKGDEVAGDGIFSVSLPFQNSNEKIKFYIRAQNNEAIKLSPERAEYQFYIYSKTKGTFELSNP